MVLKELLLALFASPQAGYFGTFLQAITTLCAAIYGLFSFNQWRKQKYMEKRSDYAEESLNCLDNAHETLMDLLHSHSLRNWMENFAKVKAEFGQARRKAHRLGDPEIDGILKKYETYLRLVETNYNVRYSEVADGSDKARADEKLSDTIKELQALYKNLYESLVRKSLIRY